MIRNILTPWSINSREPQPPHPPQKPKRLEPLLLSRVAHDKKIFYHPEPAAVVNPNPPHPPKSLKR